MVIKLDGGGGGDGVTLYGLVISGGTLIFSLSVADYMCGPGTVSLLSKAGSFGSILCIFSL